MEERIKAYAAWANEERPEHKGVAKRCWDAAWDAALKSRTKPEVGMSYETERAIETLLEKEINEIIESSKMWYPHNMAFDCRVALIRAGYKIIPPTSEGE